MQNSNTNDLIFNVQELISFLSQDTTLAKGSIILTGTPEGVGFARDPPLWLKQGDSVEVAVEDIGILCNRIEEEWGEWVDQGGGTYFLVCGILYDVCTNFYYIYIYNIYILWKKNPGSVKIFF